MKLTLLTIVLLWFAIEQSQSQTMKPIKLLTYHCKRMGLEYNQPSSFQEFELADSLFWRAKGGAFLNSIVYKIKPENADVVIGLSFYDLDKTGWVGPGVNMKYDDNNQLIGIRYLIGLPPTPEERAGKFDMDLDTNKIKFFPDEELKKYGATYGGIAEIPMDKAYWKDYRKLRILFFFKKGKGEVYQYYFYNEGGPIDKTVNDSRYILKFMERL